MKVMSWITVLAVTVSLSAQADTFWDQHAVGWHWYQDPTNTRENPGDIPVNPIQAMNQLQQQLKFARDSAILNPTPRTVRNYLILQNQISAQADRFAQVWQWVLVNDPDLNFSLRHPTNTLGKQIYLDQQRQAEDKAITRLAQHSGLFFFYRSSCPYCRRFAPVLKHFAEQYHLPLLAITTDGMTLPEFPNTRQDQGQAAQFQVYQEPALFTVDPYSQQVIPVGYGLMSEDELRSRILRIATLNRTSP